MVKKKKKKVVDAAEKEVVSKEALDDEVMVERGGVDVPVEDQPIEEQPVAEVEVRNKPIDWEPPHIHLKADNIVHVTVATVDKNDNWTVTVSFDNEASAQHFIDSVANYITSKETSDV